jgi:hypothetical protein
MAPGLIAAWLDSGKKGVLLVGVGPPSGVPRHAWRFRSTLVIPAEAEIHTRRIDGA